MDVCLLLVVRFRKNWKEMEEEKKEDNGGGDG